MPRRSVCAALFAVLALVAVLASTTLQPLTASAVTTPAKFTAVSAAPGPGVGEVTFSWAQSGASTTSYTLETGLTSFSTTDPALPDHARGSRYFTFPAGTRTGTLSATQVASAGARVGSGNHLYYRLRAVNQSSVGTATKFWPYLQIATVRPASPADSGTEIRAATFNVRTNKATTDTQTWLQRVPKVADTILDANPTVISLQELGPYRADGVGIAVGDAVRQTESLLDALAVRGGSRYKLVRYSPYVETGTHSDTQGMRILYDSSRLELTSPCTDRTGSKEWSASCTVSLPTRPSGDNEDNRRKAAYGQFKDKSTGQRFFVVSAHLDARRSADVAVEKTFDALRGTQAATAADAVGRINTEGLPVIFGSDINTWQNNKVGYAAHDVLISRGFNDTSAAEKTRNLRYTTLNYFNTLMADPGNGYGARLDAVFVKGVTGARYWENVFAISDTTRPSDHNLVLSDIVIPTASSGGTTYRPLTPSRILDTRTGVGAPSKPLTSGGRIDLDVTGRGGVPSSGVAAVVLNFTATQETGTGYVTAFPAGSTRTTASTLNYVRSQSVANTAIVKVGTGGLVSLYSSAGTHLIADVQGWFPSGSALTALSPERLLDTRIGVGAPSGPVSSGGTVKLQVTGRGGVPTTGVTSVVLNVTASGAEAGGYATAYPAGQTRSPSTVLSYSRGRSTAGSTVAKVGDDGMIELYTSATSHLIVDVQGWFPTSADVTAMAPMRLLDTRIGTGAPAGVRAAGSPLDLRVTGVGGVPSGAFAVLLTVTSTRTTRGGYVTVFPSGVIRPDTSTLNLRLDASVTNLVIVKVGASGHVTLFSSGNTHLVADVIAYVK